MSAGPVQASVIIPLYNAEPHLEEQLLALARQQTDVAWELILADNGCTDGSLAIVERLTPQIPALVRVIDASARPGTSAARNAGAQAADGDRLLFTDQDDVVDERWIEEMVCALRDHPFVGGRMEMLALNYAEQRSWRAPLGASGLPTFAGRPYVIGSNCGFTAAAWELTEGFDERFRGGGEDLDISLRAQVRGVEPVFAERALVHYRLRGGARAAASQMWGYGKATALVYRVHEIPPPTLLDLVVESYRAAKRAARALIGAETPMRPLVDMAYWLGEASMLSRELRYYKPVLCRSRVENPLRVQYDRLLRLARTAKRVNVKSHGPSSRSQRRSGRR